MKMKVYALRDIITQAYGRPFFAANDQAAIRDLALQVNSGNKQDLIAAAPENFECWDIGEYDDEDAWISNYEWDGTHHNGKRVRLVLLAELKRRETEEQRQLEALRLELEKAHQTTARLRQHNDALQAALNATNQHDQTA